MSKLDRCSGRDKEKKICCGQGRGPCPADMDERLQKYEDTNKKLDKQIDDLQKEIKSVQDEIASVQKSRMHVEQHRLALCYPPAPCCPANPSCPGAK